VRSLPDYLDAQAAEMLDKLAQGKPADFAALPSDTLPPL